MSESTNTFNIAIIAPNTIMFNKDEIVNMTHNTLSERIKDYIQFKTITFDDFIPEIVDTIKLTSDLMGSTSHCAEDSKYVYQMCHLDMENNGKKNDENIFNTLSSYLVSDGIKIYGSTVFFRSEIGINGTCITSSVNLDNIVDVLYKKLVHKCVKIDTDGNIDEIIFIGDPMEMFITDGNSCTDYQWMELPIFKFNLIVFIQVKASPNKINKKATRLIGRYRVHGDVIVASKSTENEYIDIDKQLLENLLIIAGGTLEDRNLKDEEKDDDKKIDGIPVVFNRYCVLKKRLEEHKLLCYSCKQIIDEHNNDFICTGCYRINYHDNECQKNHWNTHKPDCMYGKKPLNELLTQSK